MAGRATLALRAMTTAIGAEPSAVASRGADEVADEQIRRRQDRARERHEGRRRDEHDDEGHEERERPGEHQREQDGSCPRHQDGRPRDEDGADERKDLRDLVAEGRRPGGAWG